MVDFICEEAMKHAYEWQLIRDCIGGEHVIKAKGSKYLPKKAGQTPEDYDAYKARAKWADYTEQALEAMHGMIFRAAPAVEIPDDETLSLVMKNFDREGHNFYQFTSKTCYDNMQTSFGGLMVDMPVAEDVITEYDAQEKGIRPYVRYYPAESVINWKERDINGVRQLCLVVLKEVVEGSIDDEFSHNKITQYRVLSLDDDGIYHVRVFKPTDDNKYEYTDISVSIGDTPLKYIPFKFLPYKPRKPMLYGIAELNKHYYMQSADYENGVHFTTLPTGYLIADQMIADDKKHEAIYLGQDKFLVITDPNAKVGTLQFSGEGLVHCEKAIASTQEQIGILGTRAVSPDKSMAETADSAKIHRAGENARLATYARDISAVYTEIVQIMADWLGVKGKVNIEFNVDYDTLTYDPNALNAIANLSREGKFPLPLVYEALKRGEYLPNDFTFAQFMILIDMEEGGCTAEEEISLYQKIRAGEKVELPNNLSIGFKRDTEKPVVDEVEVEE